MLEKIYKEVNKFIDPVYLVGGSVRDFILGIEPKDYDFATPLSPDEIEKAIKKSKNEYGDNRKCYSVGKRFGTLGCKVLGCDIEITTFRTEKYSPRNRKPEVEFVKDICQDLSRRDFTFNAIAYRDGRIIDPYGGRKDLEDKVLKCVGHPTTRIKEDPLRMLRAIRFVNQLGLKHIDSQLWDVLNRDAYKILHISKERWVIELDKILSLRNPEDGLDLLMACGLLNWMIPELFIQYKFNQQNKRHRNSLWKHTVLTINNVPSDKLDLRWAALLHDIAKPYCYVQHEDRRTYVHHDYLGADMVDKLLSHLKFPNKRKNYIVEVVKNHLQEDSELRPYDLKAH